MCVGGGGEVGLGRDKFYKDVLEVGELAKLAYLFILANIGVHSGQLCSRKSPYWPLFKITNTVEFPICLY